MAVNPMYGCRMLEVTPLDEYGAPKIEDAELFEVPQEANVTFNIDEGDEQELRGGDRLIAKVKEEDYLTSADITFTNAVLNAAAIKIITGGGTIEGDDGFKAPTLSEQETGRDAFQARLYVARYNEGTVDVGDEIDYTRFTFHNCKGTLSGFNPTGGEFVVPEFNIHCTENTAAEEPIYEFDFVNELPTSS